MPGYNIGGNFTELGVNELATTVDGSVSITDNAEISLTVPNAPEQYYSAAFFGFKNSLNANLTAPDGTTMRTIVMDHSGVSPGPNIGFECTALNDKVPQVTIYWTATSNTADTVFATASTNNSNKTWQPTGGHIYSLAFDLTSNYTKAYIGGDFFDLGKPTPTNLSSYNCYGVVNLTGGPVVVQKGTTGEVVSFGPTGSALSASNSLNNFYGGFGGFRVNPVPGAEQKITCVLNVSVKDANYLFIAGALSSVSFGNNQAINVSYNPDLFFGTFSKNTACVFVVDLNRTNENYAIINFCDSGRPFDFANTVQCLEFDRDYNSLLIGTNTYSSSIVSKNGFIIGPNNNFNLNDPKKALYSPQYVSRVFVGGDKNKTIAENLEFDNQFTDKFKLSIIQPPIIQSSASTMLFEGLSSYKIQTIKYFKDVAYIGGNFFTGSSWGFAAVVCSLSGLQDYNGVCISKDSKKAPEFLRYRWPWGISFRGAKSSEHTVNSIYIDYVGPALSGEKPKEATMYIGGEYTGIYQLKSNVPVGTTSYSLLEGKTNSYICSWDLRSSLSSFPGDVVSYPEFLTNWVPKPNKFVNDVVADKSVVYVLGAFTSINASNLVYPRVRCAAITKANVDSKITKARVISDWKADLTGGGTRAEKLYLVPDSSPLSGLIILSPGLTKTATGMTKVNNLPTSEIARVTKYQQPIGDFQKQYVSWSMGCGVIDGGSIVLDTDSFVTKSVEAEQPYVVNSLTFTYPELSAGIPEVTTGQLMRFFFQRNSVSNTLTSYNNPKRTPTTQFGLSVYNHKTLSSTALYFESDENKVLAFYWGLSGGSNEVKNLTSYVTTLEEPITSTVVNLLTAKSNLEMLSGIQNYVATKTQMIYFSGGTIGSPTLTLSQTAFRTLGIPSSAIPATLSVKITAGNDDPIREKTYIGRAWVLGAKVDHEPIANSEAD